MAGMYDLFKTDPNVEQRGVTQDYGTFRVTLARAGGANKAYQKLLEKLTRPWQKAIQSGDFDNDRAMALLHEVYAKTVVLNWETKVGDEWLQGIEPATPGDLLPVTPDNLVATFKALPDLFQDLQEQAGRAMLYRASLMEAGAGN